MYNVVEILIKFLKNIKLKIFKQILRRENKNNKIAKNITKFIIILDEQKLNRQS